MAAGTAARTAALEVLRLVRAGRRFDIAFDGTVGSLSERDRRLTHEIAAGVLRNRRQLDAHIDAFVSDKHPHLEPDLRELLRIGAYQMLYLERIPGYAALATTVQVTKDQVGRGASRLANAVLRRLAEAPCHNEGEDGSLAQRYSHPDWLVERWIRRFGPEGTESLLRHNNQQPLLVVQPLGWSEDELHASFTAAGFPCRPAPLGEGVVVESGRVREFPGYDHGAFIVQDPAQASLLASLEIPSHAILWDACAAPGGKTAMLNRRARRVAASDGRRDRMPVLRDTVTRAAADVSLFVADAQIPPVAPSRVDVVVLDVPCSATGTMARHPDARWRLTLERLHGLANRQRAMLDGVAPVLGAGGRLIYLTCSLEREENEQQVETFLERHPEFVREHEDHFIFPPDAGTDGGFAAQLKRVA